MMLSFKFILSFNTHMCQALCWALQVPNLVLSPALKDKIQGDNTLVPEIGSHGAV